MVVEEMGLSKTICILIKNLQGGPKKSKPDNFCNNFVYCQPISINFGTHTL